MIDEQEVERLSRRAITILCFGLFLLAVAEGPIRRARGGMASPTEDAAACVLSLGATALATASGNPAAVLAGAAAASQCLPLAS